MTLVGAELGSSLRRDDHLPGVQAAGLACQRHDHAAVADARLGQDARVADLRSPTSASSGTRCACAIGSSSSRLGLRCPVSSRDSVLLEIPVFAARSVSVTPDLSRSV